MTTATITHEEARARTVAAIDAFLEAQRKDRKPNDVNVLYRNLEKEMKQSWKEQATDFKKEWAAPGIRKTFEAKRKGPSDKQTDALWNRAKKRGEKRQVKAVDRNIRKAVKKGGDSAMKDLQVGSQFGISFDLDHPDAVEWLRGRAADNVQGISKTSRDRIKRAIIRMVDEGMSYGEIGREIEEMIKGWAKAGTGAIASRGELIAVTEAGQAYEAGRQIVVDQFEKAGLKTEKMWLVAGDERVCSICETAESDGWISSKDEFSNGMDAPLGHPGCRCDMSVQVA